MKKIIILILIISLLTLVSANLKIEPQPADITTKVGIPQTFQMSITNNYSFQLFDFSFSNLTDFNFPDITLNPNQTKLIDFTVDKDESFSGQIQSKVKFNYFVNLPEETLTHYINITGFGYDPDYLIIRESDTVIWKNIDDITHTVTSATFDLTLLVNQSASHTFNTVETVTYQDLILFYPGTIEVINKTSQQKVHNPNYDYTWIVNLNAISNPTTLEVESLETNYTISATGLTEGMLKIKNTGNGVADKTSLYSDSDWIIFETNNFSLSIGETKYVKYTIAPLIFSTNETNKTYNINLKTKSLNTEEYTIPISVYVPYWEIPKDIKDVENILRLIENFCKQNPTNAFCNTTIGSEGEKVIYKDIEIPVNLTATEVYTMLKRMQRIEDSNQRTDNKLKLLADEWGITIPQLKELMNMSVEMQQVNEDKINSSQTLRWIIGFFIFLIVIIGSIFYRVNKYNQKKRLVEGGYTYR